MPLLFYGTVVGAPPVEPGAPLRMVAREIVFPRPVLLTQVRVVPRGTAMVDGAASPAQTVPPSFNLELFAALRHNATEDTPTYRRLHRPQQQLEYTEQRASRPLLLTPAALAEPLDSLVVRGDFELLTLSVEGKVASDGSVPLLLDLTTDASASPASVSPASPAQAHNTLPPTPAPPPVLTPEQLAKQAQERRLNLLKNPPKHRTLTQDKGSPTPLPPASPKLVKPIEHKIAPPALEPVSSDDDDVILIEAIDSPPAAAAQASPAPRPVSPEPMPLDDRLFSQMSDAVMATLEMGVAAAAAEPGLSQLTHEELHSQLLATEALVETQSCDNQANVFYLMAVQEEPSPSTALPLERATTAATHLRQRLESELVEALFGQTVIESELARWNDDENAAETAKMVAEALASALDTATPSNAASVFELVRDQLVQAMSYYTHGADGHRVGAKLIESVCELLVSHLHASRPTVRGLRPALSTLPVLSAVVAALDKIEPDLGSSQMRQSGLAERLFDLATNEHVISLSCLDMFEALVGAAEWPGRGGLVEFNRPLDDVYPDASSVTAAWITRTVHSIQPAPVNHAAATLLALCSANDALAQVNTLAKYQDDNSDTAVNLEQALHQLIAASLELLRLQPVSNNASAHHDPLHGTRAWLHYCNFHFFVPSLAILLGRASSLPLWPTGTLVRELLGILFRSPEVRLWLLLRPAELDVLEQALGLFANANPDMPPLNMMSLSTTPTWDHLMSILRATCDAWNVLLLLWNSQPTASNDYLLVTMTNRLVTRQLGREALAMLCHVTGSWLDLAHLMDVGTDLLATQPAADLDGDLSEAAVDLVVHPLQTIFTTMFGRTEQGLLALWHDAKVFDALSQWPFEWATRINCQNLLESVRFLCVADGGGVPSLVNHVQRLLSLWPVDAIKRQPDITDDTISSEQWADAVRQKTWSSLEGIGVSLRVLFLIASPTHNYVMPLLTGQDTSHANFVALSEEPLLALCTSALQVAAKGLRVARVHMLDVHQRAQFMALLLGDVASPALQLLYAVVNSFYSDGKLKIHTHTFVPTIFSLLETLLACEETHAQTLVSIVQLQIRHLLVQLLSVRGSNETFHLAKWTTGKHFFTELLGLMVKTPANFYGMSKFILSMMPPQRSPYQRHALARLVNDTHYRDLFILHLDEFRTDLIPVVLFSCLSTLGGDVLLTRLQLLSGLMELGRSGIARTVIHTLCDTMALLMTSAVPKLPGPGSVHGSVRPVRRVSAAAALQARKLMTITNEFDKTLTTQLGPHAMSGVLGILWALGAISAHPYGRAAVRALRVRVHILVLQSEEFTRLHWAGNETLDWWCQMRLFIMDQLIPALDEHTDGGAADTVPTVPATEEAELRAIERAYSHPATSSDRRLDQVTTQLLDMVATAPPVLFPESIVPTTLQDLANKVGWNLNPSPMASVYPTGPSKPPIVGSKRPAFRHTIGSRAPSMHVDEFTRSSSTPTTTPTPSAPSGVRPSIQFRTLQPASTSPMPTKSSLSSSSHSRNDGRRSAFATAAAGKKQRSHSRSRSRSRSRSPPPRDRIRIARNGRR